MTGDGQWAPCTRCRALWPSEALTARVRTNARPVRLCAPCEAVWARLGLLR